MHGTDDRPYVSFASGSFSGAMTGKICAKGAQGYLERASGSISVPSQLVFIANNDLEADSATQFQFSDPDNADAGEFSVLIGGIPSPTPGTLTNLDTCGGVVLTAVFSATAACGAASNPAACPPGCAPYGTAFAPTCQPITPRISYQAEAVDDCVLGTQTPLGSWSLTFSSVTLIDPPDGAFGTGEYLVHGTLSASLVGQDADGGTGTTELELSF